MPFRPFLKDRTTTGGLARLQDTSEASIRGTVSGTPSEGRLVEGVSITGSATRVTHGLGRRWTGCFIVRSDSAISIAAAASEDDTRFVSVTGSGTATCDLWVF